MEKLIDNFFQTIQFFIENTVAYFENKVAQPEKSERFQLFAI